MYRRPKFLELLHEIREEMSREADYDVEDFSAMVKSGEKPQSIANSEKGIGFHTVTTFKEITEIEEQFPKSGK